MRVQVYRNFGRKTVAIGAVNLTGNQTREFRATLPGQPKKILLNASYDVRCAEADAKQVY